ncbi:MAG: hypothetical protein SOY94_01240 [Candidatus Limiplasma sp.]|nr:hypothetical protein [Candidatus Limiplasma sp.]
MMNDDQKIMDYMAGYVAGNAKDEHNMRNFTRAWNLLNLFIINAGPELKIESVGDFKKAISDFNDRVQAMKIPDLEVTANEN